MALDWKAGEKDGAKCRRCKRYLSPREVTAYRVRCEDCWALSEVACARGVPITVLGQVGMEVQRRGKGRRER